MDVRWEVLTDGIFRLNKSSLSLKVIGSQNRKQQPQELDTITVSEYTNLGAGTAVSIHNETQRNAAQGPSTPHRLTRPAHFTPFHANSTCSSKLPPHTLWKTRHSLSTGTGSSRVVRAPSPQQATSVKTKTKATRKENKGERDRRF